MPISTAPAEKWSDLAALLGDCLVVHAGVEGKGPALDALFASLSNETLTLFFWRLDVRYGSGPRHSGNDRYAWALSHFLSQCDIMTRPDVVNSGKADGLFDIVGARRVVFVEVDSAGGS